MKNKNEKDISGVFGESITFRTVADKIVATNRPRRQATRLTQNQIDYREKFQEAASYASRKMKDESAKALYTAKVNDKKQNAFALAVRDYLVPPKVREIDATDYSGAIGDVIVARAIDDFQVTKVKFVITDPSGAVIEQGFATSPSNDLLWEYKTTVANPTLAGTKIAVTAFDIPGHQGSMEIVLQ